jgi:hypothetical protein
MRVLLWDISETGCEYGMVDGTSTWSCPVVGCGFVPLSSFFYSW